MVVFIAGFFLQWEGDLGTYAPLLVTDYQRISLTQTTRHNVHYELLAALSVLTKNLSPTRFNPTVKNINSCLTLT